MTNFSWLKHKKRAGGPLGSKITILFHSSSIWGAYEKFIGNVNKAVKNIDEEPWKEL